MFINGPLSGVCLSGIWSTWPTCIETAARSNPVLDMTTPRSYKLGNVTDDYGGRLYFQHRRKRSPRLFTFPLVEPCNTTGEKQHEHLYVRPIRTRNKNVALYQPHRTNTVIALHGQRVHAFCNMLKSTQLGSSTYGMCNDGIFYGLPVCMAHCTSHRFDKNMRVRVTKPDLEQAVVPNVPDVIRHGTVAAIGCAKRFHYTGDSVVECDDGVWRGVFGICEPIEDVAAPRPRCHGRRCNP